MEQIIIYLDSGTFAIALERALRPALRGAPVAVAPRHSDRVGIWECSKEAGLCGIEQGTPVAVAKKLCSDLIILEPRPDFYIEVQRKIEHKIFDKFTPLFEIDGPGNAYLDMSGLGGLFGAPEDMALALKKQMKDEFKLEASLGIAKNKLVSKVAATIREERAEFQLVELGREQYFLSPQDVCVLPVYQKILMHHQSKLDNPFVELNIKKIADLMHEDPLILQVAFGEFAEQARLNALGIDDSPVVSREKKISLQESQHFHPPCNDQGKLLDSGAKILQNLSYKLRHQGQLATALQVFIRYEDFRSVVKKESFKIPSCCSKIFFQYYMQIYKKIVTRRVCIKYLSIELMVSQNNEIQLSLFSEPGAQLESTLDKIKDRFGKKSIGFG